MTGRTYFLRDIYSKRQIKTNDIFIRNYKQISPNNRSQEEHIALRCNIYRQADKTNEKKKKKKEEEERKKPSKHWLLTFS